MGDTCSVGRSEENFVKFFSPSCGLWGLISAQQACTVRAFLCWCFLCEREDEAMTHLEHGLFMTREAYEETDMAEPSPMRVALLDGRSLPVP